MRIALSAVLIFGIFAGLSSAFGHRGWNGYYGGQCSWSKQPANQGQPTPPATPPASPQ